METPQKKRKTLSNILLKAVTNDDRKLVKETLEEGADVNSTNHINEFPLLLAALYGFNDILNDLIDAGADVNQQTDSGSTALQKASEYSNVDAVKALLKAGARTETQDNFGSTALHQAAEFGGIDVLNALLEAGANMEIKDNDGYTPLWLAATTPNTEDNILMLNALIEKGANVNVNNGVFSPVISTSANNDLEELNVLIEAGADLNFQRIHNALYYAAKNGHVDVVNALIKGGADVDLVSQPGEYSSGLRHRGGVSPLHVAINYNQTQVVKELIKKGADLEGALHEFLVGYVEDLSDLEILDVLLEAHVEQGVDIDETNLPANLEEEIREAALQIEAAKLRRVDMFVKRAQ